MPLCPERCPCDGALRLGVDLALLNHVCIPKEGACVAIPNPMSLVCAPRRVAPVSSPALTANCALLFRSESQVPTFVSAMQITDARLVQRCAVTDSHGGA